jgi:acyl-CoA synthetase (AMP-forming)/AMP-acid ligase II
MMSSGRPIPNTRVRVLDKNGDDAPPRVVGEIAIQSDSMLTGYYNRPDLTEKAFMDGWYLTGDYGYFAEGELYVSGRKKEMIIVGGKNIYPQDIETLVYEVPGIHPGRAVAFGIYDEKSGTEEVVVVAESDIPEEESRRALAEEVRQHVTKNSPIALRRVQIVESKWILKTSSGKPARTANRDKYLAEFGDARRN